MILTILISRKPPDPLRNRVSFGKNHSISHRGISRGDQAPKLLFASGINLKKHDMIISPDLKKGDVLVEHFFILDTTDERIKIPIILYRFRDQTISIDQKKHFFSEITPDFYRQITPEQFPPLKPYIPGYTRDTPPPSFSPFPPVKDVIHFQKSLRWIKLYHQLFSEVFRYINLPLRRGNHLISVQYTRPILLKQYDHLYYQKFTIPLLLYPPNQKHPTSITLNLPPGDHPKTDLGKPHFNQDNVVRWNRIAPDRKEIEVTFPPPPSPLFKLLPYTAPVITTLFMFILLLLHRKLIQKTLKKDRDTTLTIFFNLLIAFLLQPFLYNLYFKAPNLLQYLNNHAIAIKYPPSCNPFLMLIYPAIISLILIFSLLFSRNRLS